MPRKALVARRGAARTQTHVDTEITDLTAAGVTVLHTYPAALLVEGDDAAMARVVAAGFRVKPLDRAGRVIVHGNVIDFTQPAPAPPAGLAIPGPLAASWPHHLVGLAGPPHADWVRQIEAQGLTVVETLGSCGLFVHGPPDRIAAVDGLPFVDWTGPFQPAWRISPRLIEARETALRRAPDDQGRQPIQYVGVGVYPVAEAAGVRAAIVAGGDPVLAEHTRRHRAGGGFAVLRVELDASRVEEIARLPHVRWLSHRASAILGEGEHSAQILADNHVDPSSTATVPDSYEDTLDDLGVDGSGVTVAICDFSVDTAYDGDMHDDLKGKQQGYHNLTDVDPTVIVEDKFGHGTHVASVAVGSGDSGATDGDGELLGLGVAPGADFANVVLAHYDPDSNSDDWPELVSSLQTTADMENVFKAAAQLDAQVANNSWKMGLSTEPPYPYAEEDSAVDEAVRDPDDDDATAGELPLVFSAGNLGGNASTLTSPKEAKNAVVVGASCGARAEGLPTDDVKSVAGFSSRGPTSDGRIRPHVVAPGTDVVGARPQQQYPKFEELLPAFTDEDGTTHSGHLIQEGTSTAAPHVSGLVALYIEWWQANHDGKTPSPAMLKALLVNGARDLGGGENWRVHRAWDPDWTGSTSSLPNRFKSIDLEAIPDKVFESYYDEDTEEFVHVELTQVATQDDLTGDGMWAVDTSTVGAPVLYARSTLGFVKFSQTMNPKTNLYDRTRLMYRDAAPLDHIPDNHQGWGRAALKTVLLQDPADDRGPKICFDQQHAFDATLQEFTVRVAPKYTDRPLRVTLAWTDAAAAPDDADVLTNDLNLEVVEEATSQTYWGNNFDPATGFSTAGGTADGADNLECVYIENPSGTYEINVIAWVLNEDARHAGAVGDPWQDFALVIDNGELASADPAAVVPVVDRSGSMVTSGYVDVTRAATRQFVDLMEVDDRLGVVSFGTDATGEFTDAAGTGLETVTGDTERDAAQAAVDAIAFGGSTNMGGGIAAAKALLPPDTDPVQRALVLLSDGYDNQGNDSANPTAAQAVADAPAVPIYTCALGPLSDQDLLAQIAEDTGGKYYYMPDIDDLFEIYNFIRGRLFSQGVIVNESASASSAQVRVPVDCTATELTITLAWADPSVRFVDRPIRARGPDTGAMDIQLFAPGDRPVHRHASHVQRTISPGHVAFTIAEPPAGDWVVQVETAADTHVRFTVGGFVQSPIQLAVEAPLAVAAGTSIPLEARLTEDGAPLHDARLAGWITRPVMGLDRVRQRFQRQMGALDLPTIRQEPELPEAIARLAALRAQLVGGGKPDPLAHIREELPLHAPRVDLQHARALPASPQAGPTRIAGNALRRGRIAIPATVRDPGFFRQIEATESGSTSVVVTASGVAPQAGCRFQRLQMASVRVRPDGALA